MKRALASLLTAALLPACSLLTDTSKIDPLKDPDGFSQAFADEGAKYVARCSAASKELAVAQMNYYYLPYLQQMSRAAQAGRQRYDRSLAGQCITALADLPCNLDLPPSCEMSAILPPAVSAGGACTSSAECASPADGCYFAAASCPGTCKAPGNYGTPCYGPANLPGCVSTAFCAGATGSAPGTCTANLSYGADCSSGACASGYYCNFTAAPYTCASRSYLGGSCTYDYQCADGTFCNAGTCTQYEPVGSGCTAAGKRCTAGTFCAPETGLCATNPTGPSLRLGRCASPRYCDVALDYCDASSICQPIVAAGGSCSSNAQCGLNSFCNSNLKCQPYADVGGACHTGAGECLSGLFCNAPAGAPAGTAGTCLAPMLGLPCGQVNAGESAYCLEGQCNATGAAGICVHYIPQGGNCTTLQCDPWQYLTCVGGVCQPDASCHP